MRDRVRLRPVGRVGPSPEWVERSERMAKTIGPETAFGRRQRRRRRLGRAGQTNEYAMRLALQQSTTTDSDQGGKDQIAQKSNVPPEQGSSFPPDFVLAGIPHESILS